MRQTVNQRKVRAISREIEAEINSVTQKELTRLYRNLRRELFLTNRHRPELAKFQLNDIYASFITRLMKKILAIAKSDSGKLAMISVPILLEALNRKDFEFDTNQLANAFEPYLAQRITKVTQNIKRTVARKVTAWYSRPGATLQEIVDELSPMNEGSPFGIGRAHLIASTEICHLNSGVQEQTASQLGVKKWWFQTMRDQSVCTNKLIGPDGRTYKGCHELHGKVFKVGDKMPPMHPGDRCNAVLIVGDK